MGMVGGEGLADEARGVFDVRGPDVHGVSPQVEAAQRAGGRAHSQASVVRAQDGDPRAPEGLDEMPAAARYDGPAHDVIECVDGCARAAEDLSEDDAGRGAFIALFIQRSGGGRAGVQR